ncbi:MAG: hypothetical protein C4538_00915 [Nitrospiraceae bacterium]|nr:MAG: hypothetical protein C4538_00915 [Nitrospiraceae bacterium]
MDIDIRIGKESLTINIENPHRFDLTQIIRNIIDFGRKKGLDIQDLRVEQLIPRMIRGVAGCEGGCPSNAKNVAKEGFGNFNLSYVEGGILKAVYSLSNGDPFEIKVFPEFN